MAVPGKEVVPGRGTTSGPGVAWVNPGNIVASDNVRATCSLSSGSPNSQILHADEFNFGIPPESDLLGIEVNAEWRKTGTGDVNCNSFRLEENLVQPAGSDDKAGPTALPATEATSTFGGVADLWAANFRLAADLIALAFGIGLTCQRATLSPVAEVDHISVTLTYNAPGRFRTRGLRRWAYGHR